MQAKEFRYGVALESDGRMLAEGKGELDPPEAWSPDHLVVAALLRCSLQSLEFHAERENVLVSGRGAGRALVTKRANDGRYALVEIAVELEVDLRPEPDGDAVTELLEKAERDCFVGASLTVEPSYRWKVNGRELTPAAPS